MEESSAKYSSEAVTRGIRVHVEPQYDPTRSQPLENQWFFLYTVTIQLLTRHWIITDENGRVEEVKGPGVVGEQPTLAPGQGFRTPRGAR